MGILPRSTWRTLPRIVSGPPRRLGNVRERGTHGDPPKRRTLSANRRRPVTESRPRISDFGLRGFTLLTKRPITERRRVPAGHRRTIKRAPRPSKMRARSLMPVQRPPTGRSISTDAQSCPTNGDATVERREARQRPLPASTMSRAREQAERLARKPHPTRRQRCFALRSS